MDLTGIKEIPVVGGAGKADELYRGAECQKTPEYELLKVDAWRTVMRTGGVIDIEESAFDRAFTRTKRMWVGMGYLAWRMRNIFVKGLLGCGGVGVSGDHPQGWGCKG